MSTDGYEHSEYWYDYTRNDPNRENPFKKMTVDTEKYLDFVAGELALQVVTMQNFLEDYQN